MYVWYLCRYVRTYVVMYSVFVFLLDWQAPVRRCSQLLLDYHCDHLSSSRQRLLKVPEPRCTTQRWQSVGTAHIGQAGKKYPSCIYMYVCVYVCMYVRMYVFMYVCVCIYVRMCVYMYVCMYVCITYLQAFGLLHLPLYARLSARKQTPKNWLICFPDPKSPPPLLPALSWVTMDFYFLASKAFRPVLGPKQLTRQWVSGLEGDHSI
jgi:hypothetical protein